MTEERECQVSRLFSAWDGDTEELLELVNMINRIRARAIETEQKRIRNIIINYSLRRSEVLSDLRVCDELLTAIG